MRECPIAPFTELSSKGSSKGGDPDLGGGMTPSGEKTGAWWSDATLALVHPGAREIEDSDLR